MFDCFPKLICETYGICRTKGNILKKNEIPGPSNVWQDMIVSEDGMLVEHEGSDDADANKENSFLDESQQTSQEEMGSSYQTQISESFNKRAAPEKISSLRLDRQGTTKRKKNDVPLENLVASCTSIGNSIATLLNPATNSLSKEDYHFGLSIAESLGKISNPKKKLALKAQILLLIAEEVD